MKKYTMHFQSVFLKYHFTHFLLIYIQFIYTFSILQLAFLLFQIMY